MTPSQLAEQVYQHTSNVLGTLRHAGVTVDYVQVGNEINSGMLWPWGQTWDVDTTDSVTGAQWDNLAVFLNAGIRTTHDAMPAARTLLHLTNLNDRPARVVRCRAGRRGVGTRRPGAGRNLLGASLDRRAG